MSFFAGATESFGPAGIAVNALAPGYRRTPTLERMAITPAGDVARGLEQLTANIPLRRAGRSEDAGAIAAFPASEQAPPSTVPLFS